MNAFSVYWIFHHRSIRLADFRFAYALCFVFVVVIAQFRLHLFSVHWIFSMIYRSSVNHHPHFYRFIILFAIFLSSFLFQTWKVAQLLFIQLIHLVRHNFHPLQKVHAFSSLASFILHHLPLPLANTVACQMCLMPRSYWILVGY